MKAEDIKKIWTKYKEKYLGFPASIHRSDFYKAIKEAIELHEASKEDIIRRISEFADPKGAYSNMDKQTRLEAIHSLICLHKTGQYAPEVE